MSTLRVVKLLSSKHLEIVVQILSPKVCPMLYSFHSGKQMHKYRKTSNKNPHCLFVHDKKPQRLIETQRLLETWHLFLSCTNGKIQVSISEGN